MLTVAHVSAYYPPHRGGVEVVVDEISSELAERNYDVRVFTSNIGAKNEPSTKKSKNYLLRRIKGVEIAHTPVMWTLPVHLMLLPGKSIIHVHMAQAGMPEIALAVAKIRGFKYIAHFHLDVEPSGRLGSLFLLYKKYVLGFTLRKADSVVVFSNKQKDFVNKKYNVKCENIHIIPNGVSEKYFQKRTNNKLKLELLSVGRLTNQKRIDRVIKAVGKMNAPVHLTVVGDGEDRNDLEELANVVAKDKVTFVGEKKPQYVREYYKDSDIFVIPSDKEGMPIVMLEAMAAGLPVVGSNVLGIHELLYGVGVLVNNPSPETFARAITELQNDSERLLDLSNKSVQCAKKYSWEKIVTMIEKLYV